MAECFDTIHERVTTFGLNSVLAERVGFAVCLFSRQDRGRVDFAISHFPLLLLLYTRVALLDFLSEGLGERFVEPIYLWFPFLLPRVPFV